MAQYSAIVLGATGNVGGRIVQLLIRNPLCKKLVVVTRRKSGAFADPKGSSCANRSSAKYSKIIGEKEKAVESVKFDFLGLYRPGVILGNSNTPGVLGYVMPLLHWAMPSKYHSIHKNDLARAMVAQSERAFLAIVQGNAPKDPIVKILEYKEMEPFFVKGQSDEP